MHVCDVLCKNYECVWNHSEIFGSFIISVFFLSLFIYYYTALSFIRFEFVSFKRYQLEYYHRPNAPFAHAEQHHKQNSHLSVKLSSFHMAKKKFYKSYKRGKAHQNEINEWFISCGSRYVVLRLWHIQHVTDAFHNTC